MNHLIFGLMQISSPGYYLTWIFPSGKNCHAVVIPGFKCVVGTDTTVVGIHYLISKYYYGHRLDINRLQTSIVHFCTYT